MKRFMSLCFLFFLLVNATTASASSATSMDSPIGYWKTIDDKTGKPKSILKIWQTSNGTLEGKIADIYPEPGTSKHDVCTTCKGERFNKPYLGMVILWGLKPQDKSWGGGKILDPRSGKIYSVNMKVIHQGKRLEVRGYLGVSLLGRTQTWERVNK